MTRERGVFKRELAENARALYRAIQGFHRMHGYAPTLRELGEMTCIKSLSTVFNHLQTLKRRGLVTWVKGDARTITICGKLESEDNEK